MSLGRIPLRTFLANEGVFNSTAVPLFTKDGLLPTEHIGICLKESYPKYILKVSNIPIFPVAFSEGTSNYLASYPEIWKQAAIRVTFHPSICGRMPVFGVPFKLAVELALKNGHTRSKFFFPERLARGRYETLLLQLDHITDIRGELVQLQAWQYSPGTNHAHYLHALSPDFKTEIYHLDGAIIQFSEQDLEVFLRESRKVKGDSYEKRFRLDGAFDIEHMHKLARTFFPTEELYNEAFEVLPSEYDA